MLTDLDDEEDTLGVDPQLTENPTQAAAIAEALVDSDAVFSYPGEPSNLTKMQQIRNVFAMPDANLHTACAYRNVYETGAPPQLQAVSFLSDLRCQYLRRLLEENIIHPEVGWLFYLRNRMWHVRMREQLRLHIDVAYREEGDSDDTIH